MINFILYGESEPRYFVKQFGIICGRQYDHNSDFIQVEKPFSEETSECTLNIYHNNTLLEAINIGDDPIPLTDNVTQYVQVEGMFSFKREDESIKNSEVFTMRFLRAKKPSAEQKVYANVANDTVTPETLLEGTTAHDSEGNLIVGTYVP